MADIFTLPNHIRRLVLSEAIMSIFDAQKVNKGKNISLAKENHKKAAAKQ